MLKRFFAVACLIILPASATLSPYEKTILGSISGNARLTTADFEMLESLPEGVYQEQLIALGSDHNVLFKAYPALKEKISYIAFAEVPTPIVHCRQLQQQFPEVTLYLKHDGLTGKINADGKRLLGANKLRKLSYLLADAVAHGHDAVLTFGCAGSNHAIQTAVYAKELGLRCICMLKPQPNAHVVQKNLLLQKAAGSELHYAANNAERATATLEICVEHKKRTGMLPYIIPTGGSIARGALGYVEAAFELKEQITAGIMPTPDHIYVTLGSGGTAAGLLVGLQAAGITAKIHLILNEPEDTPGESLENLKKLCASTSELLRSFDITFPAYDFAAGDYVIVDQYTGTEYGLFTPESVEAVKLLQATENITLDGVYTGKCLSALLGGLAAGSLAGSTVLFWNTFCGENMDHITQHVNYKELPQVFHSYFEQPVQPLDQ